MQQGWGREEPGPRLPDIFNKVDLGLGRKNYGKRQIAEGKRVPFNKGFPGEYGNVQGC